MVDNVSGKDCIFATRRDEEDAGASGVAWDGDELQRIIDGVIVLPELGLSCLYDGEHAILECPEVSERVCFVGGRGCLGEPVEVNSWQ